MSSPIPIGPIAELLERSLSIRHVYGEPVRHGDTTVVPVAQSLTPSAQVVARLPVPGARAGGTRVRRPRMLRPRPRAAAVAAESG